MKKVVTAVLALMLALLPLSVVSAEASDKPYAGTTLSLMMDQGAYTTMWDGVFLDILDEITEETGIVIDLQPTQGFMDVIQVKLATNEIPDMWMHNVPQNCFLFNAPENCIAFNDAPWFSRLNNTAHYLYTDGNLYALPVQSATWFPGIYYNKDILAEVGYPDAHPTTMQELYDICAAIKEKRPDVTPLYMVDGNTTRTQLFVTMGLGVGLADQEETWQKLMSNQLKFADVPECIRIMEDFKRFYDEGYVNADHMSVMNEDAANAMCDGSAAMFICDETFATNIHNTNPKLNLGSFVVPFFDQDVGITGTFVSGIFANKNSKNVDAIKEWLNVFSQPKYYSRFVQENGLFSAFSDVESAKVIPAVDNLYQYILSGNYKTEFNAYLDQQKGLLDSYLFYLYADCISGQCTPVEMWQRWDTKFEEFQRQIGVSGF